jgi:multidrug efflux system membrane fusion protein
MRIPCKRGLALPLILVFVSLAMAGCGKRSPSTARGGSGGRAGNEGPVPVSVATVEQRDVPIYLDGLGTVQAFNTATLRPQVSGRLIAVPFKEGDAVKKGDVVARVDPRTYQAALDQAQAKKAQDEAQLKIARVDLKRYLDLMPQGYVTQQQTDQQKALVAQYEATVQADEAAIESDRVQLSYCTITAPFDGVLGIRQVDVGNLVSASDTTGIVVITQIQPISVTFTLPEQVLTQLRSADGKTLPVLAVSRNDESVLAEGKLTAYDNQIDQNTGTIKLKATFGNEQRKLWPGQFVNARLLVRVQHNGLVIPAQAVQQGPNGAYVYTVKPDRTVAMQGVEVAQSGEGVALIGQGLSAGEQVVTDGQYRLQPGAKVRASAAADATETAGAVHRGGSSDTSSPAAARAAQ